MDSNSRAAAALLCFRNISPKIFTKRLTSLF